MDFPSESAGENSDGSPIRERGSKREKGEKKRESECITVLSDGSTENYIFMKRDLYTSKETVYIHKSLSSYT